MVSRIISTKLGRKIRRRDLLKGVGAFGVASAFPAIITRSAFAAGPPTLVNSIRSLSNPYHATWNNGGYRQLVERVDVMKPILIRSIVT